MTLNPTSSKGTGGGGSGTVTAVSSTNTAIAVATPTTTPALTLATLDVIAADGPPAADWSNNSHKITSLANGSAAQDAAAFGQIPTALPPNGAAGGDLAGTYPNPTIGANKVTVAKLAAAVTLDAIATANATAAAVAMNAKKITGLANGSAAQDAAAFGQIPTALPPNGAAGGSLAGTYPNPTIAAGVVGLAALTYYPYVSPLISGAKGQSTPRQLATDSTGLTLTSQQVNGCAVYLPTGIVITSISFVSTATALIAGNHQVFGLYNNALGLLATTTDDTSTAWAANTIKTLNLTPGTFTTAYDGLYYLVCLVDAATPPTVVATPNAINAVIFSGLAYPFARFDTARTTLPATITYASTPTKGIWGYCS